MEQDLIPKGAAQEEISAATSEVEETTSKQPRTYTEEEWRTFQSKADKQIAEASNRFRETEAHLTRMTEDYQSLSETVKELENEIVRKEETAFEGDTEGLSAAKMRREVIKAKKELAQKEKVIARREEELTKILREQSITEIARQYNVKPELLKYAVSYAEAEELAKAIQQERGLQPLKLATKETPGFDIGVSDVGASKTLTIEQVKKMSLEERMARIDEIAKLPLGMGKK